MGTDHPPRDFPAGAAGLARTSFGSAAKPPSGSHRDAIITLRGRGGGPGPPRSRPCSHHGGRHGAQRRRGGRDSLPSIRVASPLVVATYRLSRCTDGARPRAGPRRSTAIAVAGPLRPAGQGPGLCQLPPPSSRCMEGTRRRAGLCLSIAVAAAGPLRHAVQDSGDSPRPRLAE